MPRIVTHMDTTDGTQEVTFDGLVAYLIGQLGRTLTKEEVARAGGWATAKSAKGGAVTMDRIVTIARAYDVNPVEMLAGLDRITAAEIDDAQATEGSTPPFREGRKKGGRPSPIRRPRP